MKFKYREDAEQAKFSAHRIVIGSRPIRVGWVSNCSFVVLLIALLHGSFPSWTSCRLLVISVLSISGLLLLVYCCWLQGDGNHEKAVVFVHFNSELVSAECVGSIVNDASEMAGLWLDRRTVSEAFRVVCCCDARQSAALWRQTQRIW